MKKENKLSCQIKHKDEGQTKWWYDKVWLTPLNGTSIFTWLAKYFESKILFGNLFIWSFD